MTRTLRTISISAAAIAMFIAGAAFGSHHSPSTALAATEAGAAATPAPVANTFGQPKTILQISLLKWRDGASDADTQKIIADIRTMAAQIPGVKNVWLKVSRMQPTNFDAAFVIEFTDRAAADRYAESPTHEAWSRRLQVLRETSISPQITN